MKNGGRKTAGANARLVGGTGICKWVDSKIIAVEQGTYNTETPERSTSSHEARARQGLRQAHGNDAGVIKHTKTKLKTATEDKQPNTVSEPKEDDARNCRETDYNDDPTTPIFSYVQFITIS